MSSYPHSVNACHLRQGREIGNIKKRSRIEYTSRLFDVFDLLRLAERVSSYKISVKKMA